MASDYSRLISASRWVGG